MKKRIISFLTAVVMIFTMLPQIPITAFAEEQGAALPSGNCGPGGSDTATYKVYDTDGDKKGDKLVISGTGATVNLHYTDYPLIQDDNKYTITTIVIEEGITAIGEYLFCGMTGVTAIHIPDSLTSIGCASVADCTALTDIVFSDSPTLESLDVGAFSGCTSLNDNDLFTLAPLETLGSQCLYNTAYSTVILPQTVTTVNKDTISSENKVIYMPQNAIPAYTDELDFYAGIVIGYSLNNDTKTATLTLHDTRYSSDQFVEDGVTIPATLLGYEVVAVINQLDRLTVNCSGHKFENYTCRICKYTTMCGTDCRWEFDEATGTLSIIGTGAMEAYSTETSAPWNDLKDKIIKIKIAEGITRIGQRSFNGATNLKTVEFEGNAVKSIGQFAFADCTSLTDIDLNALTNITLIETAAFARNTGLGEITLNAQPLNLMENVFHGIPGIKVAISENTKIAEQQNALQFDIMQYKVTDGKRYVTIPFADMCEIPDIEYLNGELSEQLEQLIKLKDDYKDSYTFDGYTYGTDVDFTSFTYAINEGSVTGAGEYNLNLTFEYYTNSKDTSGNLIKETHSASIPFNVVKAITEDMVSVSNELFVYDGEEQKPIVTVKDGSVTLAEGTDYTVSYSNNINATTETSKAKVTVAGIGNYKGKVTKEFEIGKSKPTAANFKFTPPANLTYDGNAKAATVTADGVTGVGEIAVLYQKYGAQGNLLEAIDAGTYKVIIGVKAGGNFTVSQEHITADSWTFTINPADIAGTTVTFSSEEYVYNYGQITPDITVKHGDTTLVENTDYSLTYSNNVNAGTAKVTVKGIGNYTGEIEKEFTIKPKPVDITWGEKTFYYTGKPHTVVTYINDTLGSDHLISVYGAENATNTEIGTYTATMSCIKTPYGGKEDEIYTNLIPSEATKTHTYVIKWYDGAPEATISGTKGVNGWYVSNVTLTAPERYTISKSLDETYDSQITFTEEGIFDYYLKQDGTGYIAKFEIKIDKTTPNAEISMTGAETRWTDFVNPITFDKLFNRNIEISVVATDNFSGIDSIEYVESATELSLETVKTVESWISVDSDNKITVTAEDAKEFVYYFRVTDKAGNVAYFSTNGATFDTTAPVITGITEGETYYTTQRFTVTDKNLKEVTVNGTEVTDYVLAGNTDTIYKVVATDDAGNKTTITVTMKTIASVSENIAELTTENVTADNYNDVKAADDILATEATANATDVEKAAIEAVKDKINALKKAITDDVKAYKIIHGANGSWTKGSSSTLGFTSDGNFDLFRTVKVDGKVLTEDTDYKAMSGSTVITLQEGYLKNLSVGTHKIEVVYKAFDEEYSAECNFKIEEQKISDTSDKTEVTSTPVPISTPSPTAKPAGKPVTKGETEVTVSPEPEVTAEPTETPAPTQAPANTQTGADSQQSAQAENSLPIIPIIAVAIVAILLFFILARKRREEKQ